MHQLISWAPKSLWIVIAAMKLKVLAPWKESYDKPRQCIKKQRHHFADKGHIVKAMVFPAVMYGCERWTTWKLSAKNWCFWTVVLEKTLESPLDRKEIKPVNPKGNQPWIFIGRTDAAAEAPILRPPDAKSQLIGKDPDARKDWGQNEKGMTEDKMVGWHHRLNGHEAWCAAVHGVTKSRTRVTKQQQQQSPPRAGISLLLTLQVHTDL